MTSHYGFWSDCSAGNVPACTFAQASTGVEYLIVGGYALAAHGYPRYTGGLDFWLRCGASK